MTEFMLSFGGAFIGACLGYLVATWAMRRQPIREAAMDGIAKQLIEQGLANKIAEKL